VDRRSEDSQLADAIAILACVRGERDAYVTPLREALGEIDQQPPFLIIQPFSAIEEKPDTAIRTYGHHFSCERGQYISDGLICRSCKACGQGLVKLLPKLSDVRADCLPEIWTDSTPYNFQQLRGDHVPELPKILGQDATRGPSKAIA
jgi:hypothetical protein